MIWVLKNCKLLDTHCLDVPVYRYLIRRLHLGLSSMPHEAKCVQSCSVDNLQACTDLFSFTASFPAIILRSQESKERRHNRLFWFSIRGLRKPNATSAMISSGEPELRLLFNISSLFSIILTSEIFHSYPVTLYMFTSSM